jgi:hypothetical protein
VRGRRQLGAGRLGCARPGAALLTVGARTAVDGRPAAPQRGRAARHDWPLGRAPRSYPTCQAAAPGAPRSHHPLTGSKTLQATPSPSSVPSSSAASARCCCQRRCSPTASTTARCGALARRPGRERCCASEAKRAGALIPLHNMPGDSDAEACAPALGASMGSCCLEMAGQPPPPTAGSPQGLSIAIGLSAGLETLCGQAYGAGNYRMLGKQPRACASGQRGPCQRGQLVAASGAEPAAQGPRGRWKAGPQPFARTRSCPPQRHAAPEPKAPRTISATPQACCCSARSSSAVPPAFPSACCGSRPRACWCPSARSPKYLPSPADILSGASPASSSPSVASACASEGRVASTPWAGGGGQGSQRLRGWG